MTNDECPAGLRHGCLAVRLGPVSAADLAAGKATAESCAGCHGPDGISQTADTPSLAGQPDDYIQWQLLYFHRGARKNELMELIAQSLTNEEIRNLGAYYASLLPPKPEPAPGSDALPRPGPSSPPSAAASRVTATTMPAFHLPCVSPDSAKTSCSRPCAISIGNPRRFGRRFHGGGDFRA